ncbi:DUF2062 domain-containing protein [Flavobacterium sp.]|uniref:DUF2062 domain-containing protein n=1 Tax=Flavobacterium sp. TaxID=239 RepID=UPI003C3E78E3
MKINKIITKIKAPFYQGLGIKAIINAIIVSLLLTIFPVFGVVTLLLTVVALRFKLNLPLMIIISYIATPLQYLLFIPFIHLGETIFNIQHSLISFNEIQRGFNISFWETISGLFFKLFYGVSAWTLVALPISLFSILLNNKLIPERNRNI